MKIEIDGLALQSIDTVATQTSCQVRDIARLAKERKIVAVYVGQQWYVDLDSLQQYLELQEYERTVVTGMSKNSDGRIRQVVHAARAARSHAKGVVTAVVALLIGVGGGATLQTTMINNYSQVASLQKFQYETVVSDISSNVHQLSEQAKITPRFSTSNRSIAATGSAVLLLPNVTDGRASSSRIPDFFSDVVSVSVAEDGSVAELQTVSAGGFDGSYTSRNVPFVVLPLE